MRATAVYHYAQSAYVKNPSNPLITASTYPQTPIACVSSYYDPSYRYTASGTTFDSSKNVPIFAGKTLPWNTDLNGKSNNGIVYQVPTTTASNLSNGNRSRGDQKMSHMKSHGIGTKTSLDLILSG